MLPMSPHLRCVLLANAPRAKKNSHGAGRRLFCHFDASGVFRIWNCVSRSTVDGLSCFRGIYVSASVIVAPPSRYVSYKLGVGVWNRCFCPMFIERTGLHRSNHSFIGAPISYKVYLICISVLRILMVLLGMTESN